MSTFTRDQVLINASIIEWHVHVCMYMERKHSKMHVMVMHSNGIVTVKDSEYELKHMIEATETHNWDQEAAAKTGE
jgi:hypothetical protein